jgi:hypothetical protein
VRWVANSLRTGCALLLAGCALAACASAPAVAPLRGNAPAPAGVVEATGPGASGYWAIFARETVGIAALAGKNPNDAYRSALHAGGSRRAGDAHDDSAAH